MRGPIPYVGGKSRLFKKIVSLMPEHTTYCEPFAGGAEVLFRKTPSEVEILNDPDFEIVNFYRVSQSHYQELIRYLRFLLASRKLHQMHLQTNPETLTDIQRAGRCFFLMKNSFGGLVLKQHYHYGVSQPTNYNPERIPEIIEAAQKRLQRMQIECLPYEKVLEKYDRAFTFFMVDPPYWGPKLYRHNFAESDFRLLADRLRTIKDKFILTLNDRPEVREVFHEFPIQTVEVAYTAQLNKPGKRYPELLIMNFAPDVRCSGVGSIEADR
jgi:DNA adenine methylase